MANSYFQFKQFRITQTRSAMKVGIDGVLLGAWASVSTSRAERMLDVGCGTGLIGLMLAQRAPLATIDGIDLDYESYQDAVENVAASPWNERVEIHHNSLQSYQETTSLIYDRIVSNPPYFVAGNPSPNEQRGNARHATTLSFQDLLSGVSALLHPDGLFSLILPPVESVLFLDMARDQGLYCHRMLDVFSKPNSPVSRQLMEFGFEQGETTREKLLIREGSQHEYTEEYKELTRDFYLKF